MDAIIDLLNRIEQRLAAIESVMAKPPLHEAVCKSTYSCNEVAELTTNYGIKKYRPFTVRLACKDQRIPDAQKLDNGSWLLPRQTVIRILEEGIPPERRDGHIQRE